MKIYILGPSASGKTTLAKKIANKTKIKVFHSDFILSKYDGRHKTKLTQNEYMKKIKKISKKSDWIFEGKHLIPELLEEADKIIWMKTPLVITLFRQWKRFFTDKDQRKRFTFRSNLQLSKVILGQYLGRADKNHKDDPRYAHQKKYKSILENYKEKIITIKNNQQIKRLLRKLMVD